MELKADRPLLILSVHLPCKGSRDNYLEFADCIDQLNEINRIYDGIEAETRKSQASFQII